MPAEGDQGVEATPASPSSPPSPTPSSTKKVNDNLLPPKTKLHPWEVEHAIPEPGPGGENLPLVLRPAYRFYTYAIATPRRRNFYVQMVRAVLVLGMVLVVTAIIYPELTTTDVPATDPLTGTWTLKVPADNSTAISGLVDGDDVIAGNFTVLAPSGAPLVFDVLPAGSGTWQQMMGQNVYYLPGQAPTGTVAFTAAYTDWYNFVWTNPTNATVTVYVDLNYLSSLPPV